MQEIIEKIKEIRELASTQNQKWNELNILFQKFKVQKGREYE